MTTPLATLAALDTRVEAILRAHGPCKLGEVAKHPSVSGFKYEQVMYSLKRLHAAGRVHYTGLAKARMYMLAPGAERMTPVASEPKLGDMVWARDGSAIVYGRLVGVVKRMHGGSVLTLYEMDPALGMDPVDHVALDGCKLVREIEQEESK